MGYFIIRVVTGSNIDETGFLRSVGCDFELVDICDAQKFKDQDEISKFSDGLISENNSYHPEMAAYKSLGDFLNDYFDSVLETQICKIEDDGSIKCVDKC